MHACIAYSEEPFKYRSFLYFEYNGISRALSAILLSSWILAIKLSSDEKLACNISNSNFRKLKEKKKEEKKNTRRRMQDLDLKKNNKKKEATECWLYLGSNITNYNKTQFLTIEILIKFMKQPRLLQYKLDSENQSSHTEVTMQVNVILTIVFSVLLKYGFQPILMTIL